jgi:hypothetical protein
MASEVLFTIWHGGQLATPCEDDMRESKDDSGGRLHSCHALAMRNSTLSCCCDTCEPGGQELKQSQQS